MLTRVAFFLFAITLFFIATRTAFKGWYMSDDLDTLGWTKFNQHLHYAEVALSWKFQPGNFRPVGHYFYKLLDTVAPYNFTAFVGAFQAIHLFNLLLMWLLLRRFDLPDWARALGVLFFAFHSATFDAYYRPMFVFDVLCTTFALLTFLFYLRGQWLIAALMMLLSYRAKELAIMIPPLLLLWEWQFGERKWYRLLPFFALSLNFGWQAMVMNGARPDSPYKLQFTWQALQTTVPFYVTAMFRAPWVGLLTLAAPLLVRDKRAWWGLAACWLPLLPLLFLPGRLFTVYLYLPLAGLTILLAIIAVQMNRPLVTAALLVLWLGFSYAALREYRSTALQIAADTKIYYGSLKQLIKTSAPLPHVVFEGIPFGVEEHGPAGILHYWGDRSWHFDWLESAEGRKQWPQTPLAVLSWQPFSGQLNTLVFKDIDELPSSFFIQGGTPVWHLREGWGEAAEDARWMSAKATMRLRQRADSKQFFLVIMPTDDNVKPAPMTVNVAIDGRPLRPQTVTHSGYQTLSWPVTGSASISTIAISVDRPASPPNGQTVGQLMVAGAGFLPF